MKTKKGNALVWILVVIVIIGLGWWAFASRGNNENADIATTTEEEVSLEGDMIEEIIITYDANGFSPATVTINKGQTVRWINQGDGDMWVASAMHPTHSVYPGSDIKKCGTDPNIFDQCEDGESYEFTFNEIGEWGYHNHSRANHNGRVIVE